MELLDKLLEEDYNKKDESKLKDLLKEILDRKEKILEAKAIKEKNEAEKENLEEQLISLMQDAGIIRFGSLGKSVSYSDDWDAWILKEDKEKQFDWLKEIKCDGFIKTTTEVNPKTFRSFINKEMKNEVLPDFVKIKKGYKLSIRAGKK